MKVHEVLSTLTFSNNIDSTVIEITNEGKILFDSQFNKIYELFQFLNFEVKEFNDSIEQNFTFSKYKFRTLTLEIQYENL